MLLAGIALGVVVLTLLEGFVAVLVCFWLIGALRSAYGPLMTAWLNRLFPETAKATLFSLYGQADAAGQTFGGPVVGGVARYVSMSVALAGSALLLLPCVGAYVRLSRSFRSGGKQEGNAT